MAVTATHILTSGSGTDTNSYDTASISPGANKLILCAIYNRTSSVAKPIVSGCGLTWVEIDSQVDATNNSRQTLFRAMGTPTPGALTITFEGGQSQLRCGWSISEFDNVDTSGTNGSGAIVQSAKGTVADMSSGLTVTLGAFSNANNATYGTIGHHSNAVSGDFTPGSGFTKLGDFEVESVHIQSQWKNSNDTTVEWSTSDTNPNRPACAIAVEIKAGTGIVSTYSRGDEASLPGDDTDLENIYTAQEVEDVSTSDDTRVGQSATNEYMIHQFKDDIGAATAVNLTWEGQTTWPPSSNPVVLQIYNRDTSSWDTVDSDNSSAADTDFTLSGHIADTANYKDEGGVMVCRVYQLAT